MNTAPIVPEAIEPPKSAAADPLDEQDKKATSESANLSRERIEDGASTRTELLEGILRRTGEVSHLRHWGINE